WSREASPPGDSTPRARIDAWSAARGMQLAFGIDGISVWFFLATATLTPAAILAVSWTDSRRAAAELAWLLVMEWLTLTLFAGLDFTQFVACLGILSAALAWLLSRTGGLARRAAALRLFGLHSAALLLWMLGFAVLIA